MRQKWAYLFVVLLLLLVTGIPLATTLPPSEMDFPSDDPLIIACRNGNMREVESLIKDGVNPNTADKHGLYALGIAAYIGNMSLVHYLVANGADVNYQSYHGPAILLSKNEDIALFLLEKETDLSRSKGEKGDSTYKNLFFNAAFAGWNEVLDKIYNKEVGPDLLSANGRTPLFAAAEYGHIETLKRLISWGAKIDATDKDGHTPLMAACWNGQDKVVIELIKAGADVERKDKSGKTAFILTICRCWEPTPLRDYGPTDKRPIIKALLQAGAKFDKGVIDRLIGTPCEKEYEFIKQMVGKNKSEYSE